MPKLLALESQTQERLNRPFNPISGTAVRVDLINQVRNPDTHPLPTKEGSTGTIFSSGIQHPLFPYLAQRFDPAQTVRSSEGVRPIHYANASTCLMVKYTPQVPCHNASSTFNIQFIRSTSDHHSSRPAQWAALYRLQSIMYGGVAVAF